jgi:hypothetical protein
MVIANEYSYNSLSGLCDGLKPAHPPVPILFEKNVAMCLLSGAIILTTILTVHGEVCVTKQINVNK